MSDIQLGTEPAYDAKRDAIHVAVAPLRASDPLKAGDRVWVSDGRAFKETAAMKAHTVGIVDPFLTVPIYPGDKIWVVLFPGTAKGLRHAWSHPDFPDETEVVVEDYDDGCRGC